MICYIRADKQEFSEWAAANLDGKTRTGESKNGKFRLVIMKQSDIVRFKLRWWDNVSWVKKAKKPNPNVLPKLSKAQRDAIKEEHIEVMPFLKFCLAKEPPPWGDIIITTLARPRRRLSDAERSFLNGALEWWRDHAWLSERQANWVKSLAVAAQ